MQVSVPFLLFMASSALAAAAIAFATASGRLRPQHLLTSQEWKIAAQLVAILIFTVVTIYVHNAERYNSVQFIYGRF